MELLALGGTQILDFIKEKVFDLDNLCQFVGYHNRIDEKREKLKRKLELLCSKEDDINSILQVSELHPGKKRKREVETWITCVQTKKNDVLRLQQQIGERKYSLGPWWETKLQKSIEQVEELCNKGNFESLLLDVHPSNGKELLTTTLVGENLDDGGVLERIREWLMDDQTQRIGVYGVGGVGKTATMMHIYNQLLEYSGFNVYWLTVNDDDEGFSIHKLQNDIAKEVGLDISNENDKKKRAAKLHKGILRRKECVMILDGVSGYFDLDDVGIPSQVNDCKLIITCRSMRLCRRMGCQKTIQIEPLSITEAEKLFKQKIGVQNQSDPEVEEITKEIVKECGGLPSKIISLAETLRGVDDVSEWRYILNDL